MSSGRPDQTARRQFPFVFVDESQDTTTEVVEALKTVEREPGAPFCLGFFGDPMQRIYATGTGLIEAEPTWADIPKPENFRCSTKVLNLANAIRRDGDDLIQVPGHRLGPEGVVPTPEGSAHLFILPADDTRDANLVRVREWMATQTGDNTLADAILDRLMHNAHRLNLQGESMRKRKSELTEREHPM